MTLTRAKNVTSYVMKYYPWSRLVDDSIKKKHSLHLTYPEYQRFFLACDEELRRPQAEDTSGKDEKSLAPRVHLTVTKAKNITSYALTYYPMVDAGG